MSVKVRVVFPLGPPGRCRSSFSRTGGIVILLAVGTWACASPYQTGVDCVFICKQRQLYSCLRKVEAFGSGEEHGEEEEDKDGQSEDPCEETWRGEQENGDRSLEPGFWNGPDMHLNPKNLSFLTYETGTK